MSNPSTDYIQTTEQVKWTFQISKIRKWVEERLNGKVLNACAGPTRLNHDGRIVTNDLDEDIKTDYSVDVARLAAEIDRDTFDTIVFDPPWTLYQANMRYDGNHVSKGDVAIKMDDLPQDVSRDKKQIGHARLAKDGFDYMLKPGGTVIQLSYSGGCMPRRLQYERIERVMFDPIGEAKTLIGSVDKKVQTKIG
jgi:hypothetical protein